MYPYLTREEHTKKVYRDFFDEQVMMEDADGYNSIWGPMTLVWPELYSVPGVSGREQDLASPGLRQILTNFRDYIAPDGQIFQYASGLSAHYSSMYWLSAFERAATIFNDGTFRFAARQMWGALGRKNVTGPDQALPSCARNRR